MSVFKLCLERAPIAMELAPGSEDWEFFLSVTRSLPIVYAELPQPRFCVLKVQNYRGKSSFRCLHIAKSNKWVPLTQEKIFSQSKQSSKKNRILNALRQTVKPQIDTFRAEIKLPVICPLSGKKLWTTSGTEAHVDHYSVPFKDIVANWLESEKLVSIDTLQLDRRGDLKDRAIAQSFYDFHKIHADLRLVDKTANLKKGAKRLA